MFLLRNITRFRNNLEHFVNLWGILETMGYNHFRNNEHWSYSYRMYIM